MNNPSMLFDPKKVDAAAAEMQANEEDGWIYKVKHDPKGKGYSLIQIFDEDGVFVGNV